LRQIREALETLGIDSMAILNHATPRIFYGCELHAGARDELLGLHPPTEHAGHAASVIASVWRQRWLANRIKNEEVLERVRSCGPESIKEIFRVSERPTGDTADLFPDADAGRFREPR
jgi:hypothetical protein